MLTLFYEGGVLFMSVLTLMLIVLLSLMGYLSIRSRKIMNPEDFREQLFRISEIGIAAFVIGLCAQLISLYEAFNALQGERVESSVTVVLAGFRVSMIPVVYGTIIFLCSRAYLTMVKKNLKS